MSNHEGSRLIFGLSTPRAGSTLLAAILGSHSQIYAPPEPWFLLPLLSLLDERVVAVAAHDHDLARRASADFLDDDTFVGAARGFAVAAYDTRRRRAGKQLLFDHNGRYYHIAPMLRTVFPDAHYIWIKRNPLDVVASYKTTWSVLPEDLFGAVIGPNTFDVTHSFSLLASFFEDTRSTFVLSYEELVKDPGKIVEDLCNFLSVSVEDSMLNIYDNRQLMASYSESIFGDKKIHQASTVYARSVGTWRSVLSPTDVRMVLDALGSFPFSRLGYDAELDDALRYAVFDPSSLTEYGRLAAYREAFESYPRSAMSSAVGHPDRLQTGSVESSHLMQVRALRQALDEKESLIKELAVEAEARLQLLQKADGSRAEMQRALVEQAAALAALDQALKDKETLIASLAAEADARLHLLKASDSARAHLQRELEEKEALVSSLQVEADARLQLLHASQAACAELQRALDAPRAHDHAE